jgi:hypothetical protein
MKKKEIKNEKKLSFENMTVLEFKNLRTIVGGSGITSIVDTIQATQTN